MSAYDNDPRVLKRPDKGYSVEVNNGGRRRWYEVLPSDLATIGEAWLAYDAVENGRRYPQLGIPGSGAMSADNAIHSLIGDPR